MNKSICVFCGSSDGNDPKYKKLATSLGAQFSKNSWRLVYGGASVGVMGVLADTVLENKAEVFGVMPQVLIEWEVAHKDLTELKVVDSMHSRKKTMYDHSDCFVAIPGGMGTLDEFCEIVTWAQLKKHEKPCYILNTFGFFDHLIAHFDYLVQEGFLSPQHRRLVRVVDTVEELVNEITAL